jgi:hypothetical protein
MRRSVITIGFFAIALAALFATNASAHPGSGIVVDDKGRVFFQDSTGFAIWMIDSGGRLTKYTDKLGGHFMALDPEGWFASGKLKLVERITPIGVKPALLVADGGAPVAVGRDGNLYYGLGLRDGDGVALGITRVSPDGKQLRLAPDLEEVLEKKLDGITGLAAGPDGYLYVACPSSVLKVKMDGTFTTLVSPVVVKDCDEESKDRNPYLRGLAVDARGTVYAAANGCHCVVKITPDGKVATVLKAERPWSPTGVAVFGEDVYVLEYTNSLKGWYEDEGWHPRVRKVARGGNVTTLAAVASANEILTKSFQTGKEPHLIVDLYRGAVEITANTEGAIEAEVTKEAKAGTQEAARKALKSIDVKVEQDGKTVRITSPKPKDEHPGVHSDTKAVVRVPPGTALELRTGKGNVNLNGGTGNGRITTTNGFIRVTDHKGALDLKTAHGSIIVQGGSGRLDMKTDHGEIHIRAKKVDVIARSANGDIRFAGTPGDGEQSFDSENGSIILTLPASARFRVDAQAANGTVTNEFPLTSSVSPVGESRTRLSGAVGGDSSTSIKLRTQNGNIVLKRLKAAE